MSSGICEQRRPGSACADAQADLGLHCPLTELLDTTECRKGERILGYFAHGQDDLNLRILPMFEGTFSLDAAQVMSCLSFFSNRFRDTIELSTILLLWVETEKYCEFNDSLRSA